MPVDELAALRKRRGLMLDRARIKLRLQWSPHWEVEARFTGRWWFALMAAILLLLIGVSGALLVVVIVRWAMAGDWQMLALVGSVIAISIWRTGTIIHERRRSEEDDDDEEELP